MLTLAAILAAVATAAPEPKPELQLSAADRRALVVGLERRVGGKFVLTGIEDATSACEAARSCVTGNALRVEARQDAVINSVRTVDQLLAASRVSGETPVAVVSARSARWKGSNLVVRASVYNKAAGSWTIREATISYFPGVREANMAYFPGVDAPVRTLLSWQPVG